MDDCWIDGGVAFRVFFRELLIVLSDVLVGNV